MTRLFYLCLFLLACAAPAFAQDPVKVDPDHYKVVTNNAQVRVLRVHYGPHEKSVMHWHPNSVAIPQSNGRVNFHLPGGKHMEVDMVAGQAIWSPAGRHNPENLSDSDMDVILVELKAPRRRAASMKPANTNANANR
jgi:quercetin dioxygenase-like cupin family protein